MQLVMHVLLMQKCQSFLSFCCFQNYSYLTLHLLLIYLSKCVCSLSFICPFSLSVSGMYLFCPINIQMSLDLSTVDQFLVYL